MIAREILDTITIVSPAFDRIVGDRIRCTICISRLLRSDRCRKQPLRALLRVSMSVHCVGTDYWAARSGTADFIDRVPTTDRPCQGNAAGHMRRQLLRERERSARSKCRFYALAVSWLVLTTVFTTSDRSPRRSNYYPSSSSSNGRSMKSLPPPILPMANATIKLSVIKVYNASMIIRNYRITFLATMQLFEIWRNILSYLESRTWEIETLDFILFFF